MMNREELYLDRRFLKTERALGESLLSLLKYKSFVDISITDIVKMAEINRGSFYNHYNDKKELIDKVLLKMNEKLVYAYRQPFLKNRPFMLSRLPSSEVRLFNNIYNNAEFYTTVLSSDVAALVENQIFEAFKRINIEELNVKDNKIHSDLIASYMSYAIVGLIVQWVRSGYKYEAEFMNEQLIRAYENISV